MSLGGRRDAWAWAWCLAFVVGLTATAAAGATPIDLPHGGRLPGRIIASGDPAVVRVAADLFAEPLEFVAAAVGRHDKAAEFPPFPGLPGRVGLLTSGETRLLGCLAACADGRIGWQPLGGTRPVAFADPVRPVRIDYRGLEIVGGPGITLARVGQSGERKVVDVVADGPAARDGQLHVDDMVTTIAEGVFGKPVDLVTAPADAVRLLLVGPVGSTVRLGVRQEHGIEEVALVRDTRGRDDLAGAAAKDVLDRAVAVQQSLGGIADRGPATVHLVTGESFACRVLDADERTVRVSLGDGGDLAIAGDRIRALELSPVGGRPILKQKHARLLTVPRTKQAAPPTHVVRMAGGDYLRGRLVGMDADVVRFDVGGEVKSLPRREVARIIRPADPDESAPSLRTLLADRGGLPVVVVGGDGRMQAVAATGLEADAVVGDSPACGPLAVSLGGAARVLFGAAIDEVLAAEQPYADWVLRPAAAAKPAAASP